MAKTWYVTNTIVSSAQQEMSETSPGADASSSPNYGWTVGTAAPTVYASADAGTMVTQATFGATAQPDGSIVTTSNAGDCFRTTNTYTGTFATGNWTFQGAVLVTSGSAARGRMRFRLFRGTNADGSGATEITSGALVGNIISAAGSQVTSSVTQSINSFSVSDEYLFVQVGWEITTAGGMTSHTCIIRVGTTATLVTSTDLAKTSSLSKSGTHTVSLSKAINYVSSLSKAGSHSAALSKVLTLTSSLSKSGSHAVTLSQISARLATLTQAGSHVATLSKLVAAFRSLSVAGSHSAALTKVMAAIRTLSASGSHTASITKASGHSSTLSTTGSHSVSSSRVVAALRALSVSGGRAVSLALQLAYGRSLSAAGSHVVSMLHGSGQMLGLSAVGSHLATLARQVEGLRTLSVVGFHQALIARVADRFSALQVVGSHQASLEAIYVPGGNNYPQLLTVVGSHSLSFSHALGFVRSLVVAGHGVTSLRTRMLQKIPIGRTLSDRPYTATRLAERIFSTKPRSKRTFHFTDD